MPVKKRNYQFHLADLLNPLDGRNHSKIKELLPYFSELALNKYRLLVEIKYLMALISFGILPKLNKNNTQKIYSIVEKFDYSEFEKIRKIEDKTNHDLKAVEEYLKQKLIALNLKDYAQMIHFGLTSDDTNNLAYALMIQGALQEIIIPEIKKIKLKLKQEAIKYQSLPMLGRTHGQAAIPTTLGKEYLVYYKRLSEEFKNLLNFKIKGKLLGNVGNLNLHKFVYPKINWLKFSADFVRSLQIEPDLVATQIEPYDSLINIFSSLLHINNILIGVCTDFWVYMSYGYFKQQLIDKEVGSTALPHKINPIYFEGAEGGFGLANSLFEFYIRKLSYSRLQRDLSDSTVRRSFGTAFGYCLLSYKSIIEALLRIEADREVINDDLNKYPEFISEVIQNVLRLKKDSHGYEKTKRFFRGKKRNQQEIAEFIKSLNLEKKTEQNLLDLKSVYYTGFATDLINYYFENYEA